MWRAGCPCSASMQFRSSGWHQHVIRVTPICLEANTLRQTLLTWPPACAHLTVRSAPAAPAAAQPAPAPRTASDPQHVNSDSNLAGQSPTWLERCYRLSTRVLYPVVPTRKEAVVRNHKQTTHLPDSCVLREHAEWRCLGTGLAKYVPLHNIPRWRAEGAAHPARQSSSCLCAICCASA